MENLEGYGKHVLNLRERLHKKISQGISNVRLNGHPTERLPNTLNLSFIGKDSSALLAEIPEIAASTGSACHAGSRESSPVLRAMGVPPELAFGVIRFSLGRGNTEEEIDYAADLLLEKIKK